MWRSHIATALPASQGERLFLTDVVGLPVLSVPAALSAVCLTHADGGAAVEGASPATIWADLAFVKRHKNRYAGVVCSGATLAQRSLPAKVGIKWRG